MRRTLEDDLFRTGIYAMGLRGAVLGSFDAETRPAEAEFLDCSAYACYLA